MANTHTTLSSLFTAIANAIRAKTGSTAAIVADDFPEAISGISGNMVLVGSGHSVKTGEGSSAYSTEGIVQRGSSKIDGSSVSYGCNYVDLNVEGEGIYLFDIINRSSIKMWSDMSSSGTTCIIGGSAASSERIYAFREHNVWMSSSINGIHFQSLIFNVVKNGSTFDIYNYVDGVWSPLPFQSTKIIFSHANGSGGAGFANTSCRHYIVQ